MTEAQLAELVMLHRRDGMLYPDALVEYAKDPTTAWHAEFPWEMEKAAHEHWLYLARKYIAVAVTILPQTGNQYRTFVSLVQDRNHPRGGYRPMVDVLNDAGLRKQLLADALQELRRLQQKYAELTELDKVWAAAGLVATAARRRARGGKDQRRERQEVARA